MTIGRGEQTIGADFVQSLGKNVLQAMIDELHCRKTPHPNRHIPAVNVVDLKMRSFIQAKTARVDPRGMQ